MLAEAKSEYFYAIAPNIDRLRLTFFDLGQLGQTNVWMLTPGFSIREMPVKLSNINNYLSL